MLDSVHVDAYGSLMPLNQVATVHAAEAQRMFGEDGGSGLTAPPRPPRPRKSAARRRAETLATRQLNFAAFCR